MIALDMPLMPLDMGLCVYFGDCLIRAIRASGMSGEFTSQKRMANVFDLLGKVLVVLYLAKDSEHTRGSKCTW